MKMKRTIIVLAVFALCLIISVPVFAVEGTITVKNTVNGDSYGAYQIAVGDVAEGYVWGEGISETGKEMLGDPTGAVKQLSGANRDDIVKTLKSVVGTPSAQQTASNEVAFTGLAPGLYVICDMTQGDDYRVKLLTGSRMIDLFDEKQAAGSNESQDNAGSQKPIVTQSLSVRQTVGRGGEQGQVIDAAIGDIFFVRAEGNLPDNLDAYDNYLYAVHLVPGEGIALRDDSVVVKIDGKTLSSDYHVTRTENGNVSVAFDNIKPLSIQNGANVSVTMDAALNGNAVTGAAGNPISVEATYGDEQNVTEPSQTTVYTYALEGRTVDNETKAGLGGAGFRLYRKKTESFWFGILSLFGWEDREYMSIDGGFTADAEKASIITSDENGGFSVKGLSSDKYYLEQTQAPEGYEGLKTPMPFEIISNVTQDGGSLNLTFESGEGSGDFETGIVHLTIDNKRLNNEGSSSGAANTADPSNTAKTPVASATKNKEATDEPAKDNAFSNDTQPSPASSSNASAQTQSEPKATQTSPTAPVISPSPTTTVKQPDPTPAPAEKKDNAKTGSVSRGGSFAVVVLLLIVAAVIYAVWKQRDTD